jgi:hypothetical protein
MAAVFIWSQLQQTMLAATYHAARSVWGFPKELGNFTWGDRSVKLTVNGKMIFSATFDGSSTIQYKVTAGQGDSKNSQYTPTNWFSTVAGKGIQTMQFPIQNLTVSAAAAKLDNDDSSSSSNVGHQTLQPSSVFDSVSDPNQLAADIQSASPEEAVIVQHMLAGLTQMLLPP